MSSVASSNEDINLDVGMKLSNFISGRNNNFNLIRFVAALAVLVSHGFAVTTGNDSVEPFRQHLNMTMGSMAVDAFFLTSGFLVTCSLLVRRNAIEFVCARALRIYPALWVMLLVTIFLLGGGLTTLPLLAYLKSPQTWSYLAHGATLIAGIDRELPHVFDGNPLGSGINGSLWTLPYEIGMYGILLGGWLAMGVFGRLRIALLEKAIILLAGLAGLYILIGYFRHGLPEVFELHRTYRLPGLIFMFFCGASFYVLRERIVLSGKACITLLAILLISTINKHAFYATYLLCLPYILFYLAYVPAGRHRKFNDFGDYSYGIYIYAFPVQQTVICLLPGITVWGAIAICMAITLTLSIMSWHLIEKSALDRKHKVARLVQFILRPQTIQA